MQAPVQLTTLPTRRRWVNALTRGVVALGGGAVIGAITLIFVYLLWVVAPIFAGAGIELESRFELSPDLPRIVEVNESGEMGFRVSAAGNVEFFDITSGRILNQIELEKPIRRVQRVFPQADTYVVLDTEGQLALFETSYPISFGEAGRVIGSNFTPMFADAWIDLGGVQEFDVHYADFTVTVAGLDDQQLLIRQYRDAEPGYELEPPRKIVVPLDQSYVRVLFGPRGKSLYLLGSNGEIEILDLSQVRSPRQLHRGRLVPESSTVTTIEPLLGRHSLLVADNQGKVSQWFLARDEFGRTLQKVREFEFNANVSRIVPEQRRKGFAAITTDGQIHLVYTTSERILASHPTDAGDAQALSLAPRGNLFASARTDGVVSVYRIDNEHPEISWSSLWSKVWYEGYEEPVYSWQSSSADNDFEAKFSLAPLLFGTIKAAFYAMLFAVPLAIMGALYTAYFMAPSMRRIVKPSIEIMAALPTVILGFLAGLWLAPLIEANLSAILAIVFIMPIAVALVSFLWQHLPDKLANRLEGWHGLIVVPVIVLTVVSAFTLGPILENVFFGGDSRAWLLNNLGLDYDQRNSLVVGLAMGLAVIPTIFSIAEDAVYGVPTHLINGSLALGATRWQTLMRVVILTASPGIFSAVMIGLGRAVGETMIVLMATGNTPVMNWNIFEGMRTFAANIAVELPESEVDSTHYRILFVAALVLFIITFFFNTIAELVRQQLRERYGSL